MHENVNFVIWGIGKIGKALFDFLGKERVVAFIDRNYEIIENFSGKPVISLEQYLVEFQSFFYCGIADQMCCYS